MSSDFFDLVEHRKTVQAQTLKLSADLTVIPMSRSNEDEVQTQLRQFEIVRLGKQVNELLDQAQEHAAQGRDAEAEAAVKEAAKIDQRGFTMFLEQIRTMVCTEDGKKVTVAQLRSAIGDQNEAAAVMQSAAAAGAVDPQTVIQSSGSRT